MPPTVAARDSGWGKKAAEIEQLAAAKESEKVHFRRCCSPEAPYLVRNLHQCLGYT